MMRALAVRLTNRLPSRQDLHLVLHVCVLPGHMWLWLLFLYRLPNFLLNMRLGEIGIVLAYMVSAALLETLLLCALLVLLAFLLPRRFYLDQFAAQSAYIVILAALAAVVLQVFYSGILTTSIAKQARGGLSGMFPWAIAAAGVVFILVLVSLPFGLRRWPRLASGAVGFEDRLSVLAWFFLTIDGIGLVVVMVRSLILSLS
ncbi:MAG: hypothetical protein ACKOC5_04790 [Chloroflexota bacterium]